MPRGSEKSGRFRKIFVKVPGGETKVHLRERKPKKAHCAVCGKQLAGVVRERPAVMANLPKTAKRPERPFGGVLCSSCMRLQLQQKVRSARRDEQ